MTRVLSAAIAVPSQCYLAEGPVWDPSRRLLRWVDINPGHVHALDPATGTHTRFVPVGAVGLTRSGGFVLALVDGFALGPAQPDAAGAYPLTRVDGFRVDASLI